MKNIIVLSLMVLFVISCNNSEKSSNEKTEPQEISKNDFLSDTANNVFLNLELRKKANGYFDSLKIEKNISQPLGYILIDEISDTTVLFIGTDFNHKMLFDEERIIVGFFKHNNMDVVVYIKASNILNAKDQPLNSFYKQYDSYGNLYKYKDLKAVKIKFFDNTYSVEGNYTSISHSHEVPFTPPKW